MDSNHIAWYSLKGGDNGIVSKHISKNLVNYKRKVDKFIFIITGSENILLAIIGKSNREKHKTIQTIKLNCLIQQNLHLLREYGFFQSTYVIFDCSSTQLQNINSEARSKLGFAAPFPSFCTKKLLMLFYP